MLSFFKRILAVSFVILLLIGCKETETINASSVKIPSGKGFEKLSDYNFFVGELQNLIPNTEEGVLPYDLNTALFSDYALKNRFVYVPEGLQVPFDTTGTLDFPVGSVLIKHFYYSQPGEEDLSIETRLLIHQNDGWKPETYVWNEDKSDAIRSVVGGTRELTVSILDQEETFKYAIPNQNQCKNCHGENGKIAPIGPMITNLNKEIDYEDGRSNQIDTWIAREILEQPNYASVPALPAIDNEKYSLDERARAYLTVNCSSCHRREGSAANSGLYLDYYNTDSLSLGYWKTPVAAGDGSGGFRYVINPGNADESILLYRMISRDVEVRMPELGRELMHEEGIELIRAWIDNM